MTSASPLPIIITRAEPGARETLERLQALACRPILSPMLEIVQNAMDIGPALAEAGGLIFTSANGVRAFCARTDRRDLTAWCVGPATSLTAERAGFAHVHNADGASGELAHLIRRQAHPEDGPLLHIANAAAAGALAQALRHDGFNVVFLPLYEARPAMRLAAPAIRALETAPHGVVLIHSAKGAAAFVGCVPKDIAGTWQICAVSRAAVKPLEGGAWSRFVIAKQPNEAALMAELESLLVPL